MHGPVGAAAATSAGISANPPTKRRSCGRLAFSIITAGVRGIEALGEQSRDQSRQRLDAHIDRGRRVGIDQRRPVEPDRQGAVRRMGGDELDAPRAVALAERHAERGGGGQRGGDAGNDRAGDAGGAGGGDFLIGAPENGRDRRPSA